MPTDAKARGAAHGDTLDDAALAELYRLHAGYLRRALVRITNGDHGKAEDILQETFLRAWRNPGSLTRGTAGARPWLFTVARRIAIDHFRMVGARPQEICDDAPKDRVPTCDPYDAVLDARDVAVVLNRLPAYHRDVLRALRTMFEAAGIMAA
jgi:RNA polymerase sigma-70 factor, ECF subfamily